ncbi:GDP-mannose 4,6-dehydratase [Patescibacteria group bacterium]|nr:NAD-dependent epimerase/dehydratase family protein [Candidatus Falkowbacteria bacterium]MBU3906476.1 GDP-mannose 4,6-dehydratase [Patescibacteria group bacterium]MBU4015627.1 GDP-mannose 4,6-dehydratase [Patescibacteria group bacterium]MBU4026088.1 GDP-mannose 4,6-dehydratase [Patescibacteria group bacterium]MBU4073674.1 GDP-mannose 4,6-dehydratase [Patescibacteria group bacterium]
MIKRTIFDKKNVLVTGGAGFAGSHLCDELIKTCKVICLDNFSTGDERNIDHLLEDPNFAFIKHDISEPIDLDKLPELQKFKIQFQGIQEIYHLACPTSPVHFKKNIIATILANSYGVKNALDLAKKHEAKFLHFSSSVVYGARRDGNSKISEEDLGIVDFLSDRSSYDEGKRFAETMVVNYKKFYNVDAKIARLFRVYGPRMKMDEGLMIPDFISNGLDNKDLEIFGDKDFYSSLCYVSDAVDASIKMMESESAGPINIGSDIDVKISDVAQKIISMLGSKSKITYADKLLFMTPLCLPNITKAREELGWMPVMTLEKGLEKTVNDLRANKGLKGMGRI